MAMQKEDELMQLPGGRTLSYAIYGSSTPTTTVFHNHAFPSSRLEGRTYHQAAARLGIQLVVPDRPGMGRSTLAAKRTLLDWPRDVLALADHLQVDAFYMHGISGGGPYTLACLHALPRDRLLGVAVVGGLYPLALGTQGMMLPLRFLLWTAPWAPSAWALALDVSMGRAARNPDASVFAKLSEKDVMSRPRVDKEALEEEGNKSVMVEATREALMQGGKGAAQEAAIYGGAWGFGLEGLGSKGARVRLWHGDLDVNVPVHMAIKAKEMMGEGAVLKVKEGEAHLSLAFRYGEEVLEELVRGT